MTGRDHLRYADGSEVPRGDVADLAQPMAGHTGPNDDRIATGVVLFEARCNSPGFESWDDGILRSNCLRPRPGGLVHLTGTFHDVAYLRRVAKAQP